MKLRSALVGLSLLAVLAVSATPVMANPTTFTVTWYQAQFQWRAASWGGGFGSWSGSYQNCNDPDCWSDLFTLTGKALHSAFTFSPSVTNIQGASTVYTYDKGSKKWVEHAGALSYNIADYYCPDTSLPVCNGPYVNYWTGYIDFGGETPSEASFVHGVGYQWIYYFSPQDDSTVLANIPNAVWDANVGAWLIGFSIYIWDSSGNQAYATTFPSPFIEPVPANNYNPLDL